MLLALELDQLIRAAARGRHNNEMIRLRPYKVLSVPKYIVMKCYEKNIHHIPLVHRKPHPLYLLTFIQLMKKCGLPANYVVTWGI